MTSIETSSISLVESAPQTLDCKQLWVFNSKVRNKTEEIWKSDGPNPWMVSYHWFDADWKVVVFDGVRTALPTGGIPPGGEATIPVQVQAPDQGGSFRLMITLVNEGISWLETQTNAFTPAVHCIRVEQPSCRPQSTIEITSTRESWDGITEAFRVKMTASCADAAGIPKVVEAGKIFCRNGEWVQIMHEGTIVSAGGYYGGWMEAIIAQLRGHHEPQEELLFNHLLKHVRPQSRIVELGCFWAYYSNWYLGAVDGAHAVCIEPDSNNLSVGAKNLSLNGRKADLINAAISGHFSDGVSFRRESDGVTVTIPSLDFEHVFHASGGGRIEVLHMDVQGAELPFLQSMSKSRVSENVRFVVVSTHHQQISGSYTTHRDCIAQLIKLGAVILCEHTIEESFSGDGLILASFEPNDMTLNFPPMSLNRCENSLFREKPNRIQVKTPPNLSAPLIPLHPGNLSTLELATVHFGRMLVFPNDEVIGRSMLERGAFEESEVAEVVAFLQSHFGFHPALFIDIGANIGSHLIFALRTGLFQRGVGFEDYPLNFTLLKCNVAINGIEGECLLFNVALSDRCGMANLEVSKSNLGDHRIRTHSPKNHSFYSEETRSVRQIISDTLDDLLSETGIRLHEDTLIWMDTQGYEGHILSASRHSVGSQSCRFIVVEFWPYGLNRTGGHDAYFEFLSRCRLIYDLGTDNWQSSPPLTVEQIKNRFELMVNPSIAEGVSHTNFLCVTY